MLPRIGDSVIVVRHAAPSDWPEKKPMEVVYILDNYHMLVSVEGSVRGHDASSQPDFKIFYANKYGRAPKHNFWWIAESQIQQIIPKEKLKFKDLV